MKINEPMNQKYKLIKNSNFPLLTCFGINFIEKSNQRTKKSTENRKKSYSSLWGVCNDGVKYDLLHNIVEQSVQDSLRTTISEIDVIDKNELFLKHQFLSRYYDNFSLDI